MNSIFKRAISILLVFVMCISMLPASALAEVAAEPAETEESVEAAEAAEQLSEEQTAKQAEEAALVVENESAGQEKTEPEELLIEENTLEGPSALSSSNARKVASGTCGDNLIWRLDADGLLTISGTGMMTDYLYDYPPWDSYISSIRLVKVETGVTSIGESAFSNCENLTSVEMGDSITNIGESAFLFCYSLTKVKIGDSVTSIGEAAFSDCYSLTSIEIPDSVTSIGAYAFDGCENLTSVEIGDSVTSIGDSAFEYCTSLSSVEIGNSVTYIGNYAFSGCKSLTSVEIPDSVTSIGDSAFEHCTSLTSVEIPDNVTSIGSYAFADCTSLTSIEIPDSVTSIRDYAFSSCTSLQCINVSADNNAYSSVEGVLFNKDKTALTCYPSGKTGLYSIPTSVISIGEAAFYKCVSLTGIEIPDSVTSIGVGAFFTCTSLASVEISDCVTSIGVGAFSSCTSLQCINVSADNNAYSSVEGVLFNKDKTALTCYPSGKTGLYSIPTSVISIGEAAFYECVSLTGIKIPSSVTSIGDYTFYDCKSLTSAETGDSITSIGEDAFGWCTGLISVEISNSVTSIGDYAFGHCSSLADVYYTGTEVEWNVISKGSDAIPSTATIHFNSVGIVVLSGNCGKNATWALTNDGTLIISGTGIIEDVNLDDIPEVKQNAEKLVIDEGITGINSYTFMNLSLLSSAIFPVSLITIGEKAFSSTALKTIQYAGRRDDWQGVDQLLDSLNYATIVCADNAILGYHYVEDHNNGGFMQLSFEYSEDYFMHDSDKYFDINLAILSLHAAMASVTNGNSSEGNELTDGDKFIRDFLVKLGCDTVGSTSIKTVGYENNHSLDDQCAYAFACKTLSDGTILMPVLIRSFAYGGEWCSNFRVTQSDYSDYAAGFKKPADDVYDDLMEYISDTGVDKSKLKIWIAGYSRGAAISNLLAEKLNTNSGIAQDQIYAYTFATPRVSMKSANSTENSNIFNVIAEQDIVPNVPLSEWGFVRYGNTYQIPNITNNPKVYNNNIKLFKANFKNITGTTNDIVKGQESAIDLICFYLSESIPYSDYVKSGMQDFIIEVIRVLLVEKLGNDAAIETIDESLSIDIGMIIDCYNQGKYVEGLWYINKTLSVISDHDSLAYKLLHVLTQMFEECKKLNQNAIKALSLIFSFYTDGLDNILAKQHWPESYLAWLETAKSSHSQDIDKFFASYGTTIVSVKCPVDIEVYDSNDLLVCRILDDEVDESISNSLYAYVDEYGEKHIYIPDDGNYTTNVVAREECTVSVVSTHCDAEGNRDKTVGYTDVKMSDNSNMIISDASTVSVDSTILESNFSYIDENKISVEVESTGSGMIFGEGNYNVGDTVSLNAMPDENAVFLGWFEGDTIISVDENYRFNAKDNKKLKALFADIPSKFKIDREYIVIPLTCSAEALKPSVEPEIWEKYVTWSLEDNNGTISVDENGLVTPLAVGTDYVVASITYGDTTISVRCRIDVTAKEIIYGDVNGDGACTVMDVYMLRKAAAGLIELTDEQKAVADIYADSRYNALDVNILRRYLAGIISKIPYNPLEEPVTNLSVSINGSAGYAVTGTTVTWTAEGEDGVEPYMYCFHLFRDGEEVAERSYGTLNTYSYKFTDAGTYSVLVQLKDDSGEIAEARSADVDVRTVWEQEPAIESIEQTGIGTIEMKLCSVSPASSYDIAEVTNGKNVIVKSNVTSDSITFDSVSAGSHSYAVRVSYLDSDGRNWVSAWSPVKTVSVQSSLYVVPSAPSLIFENESLAFSSSEDTAPEYQRGDILVSWRSNEYAKSYSISLEKKTNDGFESVLAESGITAINYTIEKSVFDNIPDGTVCRFGICSQGILAGETSYSYFVIAELDDSITINGVSEAHWERSSRFAGERVFEIASVLPWSADTDSSWLSVSQSGNTLKVCVTENPSDSRTGSVTVTNNEKSAVIYVTQGELMNAPELSVYGTELSTDINNPTEIPAGGFALDINDNNAVNVLLSVSQKSNGSYCAPVKDAVTSKSSIELPYEWDNITFASGSEFCIEVSGHCSSNSSLYADYETDGDAPTQKYYIRMVDDGHYLLLNGAENLSAEIYTGERIDVSASNLWTAVSDSDWLSFSVRSGRQWLTAKATENYTGNTRTGHITVTSGANTAVLTLEQPDMMPKLLYPESLSQNEASPTKIETNYFAYTACGSHLDWDCKSDDSWENIISEDWGELSKENGTIDNEYFESGKTYRLTVSDEDGNSTSYYLKRKTSTSKYIYVGGTLDTSLYSVEMPAGASTETIRLESSGSWTATSDSSWLTISKSKGSSGTTDGIVITTAANNSSSERTGSISFKISLTVYAKLQVTQAPSGSDFVQVTVDYVPAENSKALNHINGSGADLDVRVYSSGGKIKAVSDSDWMTINEEITSGKSAGIKLSENTGSKSRTGNITFTYGAATKTITVTQEPALATPAIVSPSLSTSSSSPSVLSYSDEPMTICFNRVENAKTYKIFLYYSDSKEHESYYVYVEDTEKSSYTVAFDSNWFDPTYTGMYKIRISAKDAYGNAGDGNAYYFTRPVGDAE